MRQGCLPLACYIPIMILDETFVRVTDYIPDVVVDLKYATPDNFIGKPFYHFTEAWLRYGTVKKLSAAQQTLREKGYSLKIWDAFRPVASQFILWEARPDPTFIANPYKGFSNHSRGNCVDVTIIDAQGQDVLMPTEFDAVYRIEDCHDEQALAYKEWLERIMVEAGFRALADEWWHYVDLDVYPVEEKL